MLKRAHVPSIVLVAAALSGCGTDPDVAITSLAVVTPLCEPWGCGTNTPTVGGGLAFHDIDKSGVEANSGGLKYVSFTSVLNESLQLVVAGDHLRGVVQGGPRNGMLLSGAALLGSTILLRHPNTTTNYRLRLDVVGTTEFWVAPGRDVPTYTFFAKKDGPGGEYRPLCRGHAAEPEWEGEIYAVVFRGDKYHADYLEVTATGPAVGAWFNIGCAGSAIAKLHLLRHTDAGSDFLHTTSKDQRQAMLKAITADYCGTGTPFTYAHVPLHYVDGNGWAPDPPVAGDLSEARWTANHATCLDMPRLGMGMTPSDLFHLRIKIAMKCDETDIELPSCDPADGGPGGTEYVVTANPP